MESNEDISNRETAAQKSAVACKQLQDIIEFLPYAVLAIDNDKNVLIWNCAIERMTGIPKAEIIGKHYFSCGIPFYGEARPFVLDLLVNHDRDLAAKYPC